MSWAALNQQLRELLPRFSLPADDPAALELMQRLLDLGGKGGELPRLQASGLAPSQADKQALRQTLAMAAECLAELSASIQGPVTDLATEWRVNAVCQLFSTCFHLCIDGGMPDMLNRFLPCAAFLLRCGAAAQRFAAQEVQRGSMAVEQLLSSLAAQSWALESWQLMACVMRAPHDDDAASDAAADAFAASIAQSCAPPALLHQWWQCTLLSLQLAAPSAWKPGTPYAHLLSHLSGLLGRLCSGAPFMAHRQLVLQDEQLCCGILQLLLPAISAMAVGLQLPPERRPPECTWRAAAHMALIASMVPVRACELASGLELQATRRLLPAAAQLLQHCPLGLPQADGLTVPAALNSTLYFVVQLGYAALVCTSPQQHRTAASATVQQATAAVLDRRQALQLLAVLPRAGDTLLALEQPSCTGFFEQVAGAVQPILFKLTAAAHPRTDSGVAAALYQAADLPAWCRGTVAALRWLPPIAATAATLQHCEVQNAPSHDLHLLCRMTIALALCVAYGSRSAVQQQSRAGKAVCEQDECLSALWQLHSTVCCLVHWVSAGGAPEGLCPLFKLPVLSRVLTNLLHGAALLCQEHQAAAPAGVARCMPAMCAAHSEALLAVLHESSGQEPGYELAADVLCSIRLLSVWGADALLTEPRLQSALATCLPCIPQQSLLQCCSDTQLFVGIEQSSHLAALVVAEGLLDRIVQATCAAPTHSLSLSALRVASTVVNQLLEEAQQAAHQPAAEASAALLAAAADAWQSLGGSNRADLPHPSLYSFDCLPPTRRLAAALLAWWRRPEAQPTAALEVAQAAAARSCAYLRCANLGGQGGPAAGQGAGSQRCSACRAVWYCGTACSHADWRAGHRRVCKALGTARAAEKERRRQAAAEAGAAPPEAE